MSPLEVRNSHYYRAHKCFQLCGIGKIASDGVKLKLSIRTEDPAVLSTISNNERQLPVRAKDSAALSEATGKKIEMPIRTKAPVALSKHSVNHSKQDRASSRMAIKKVNARAYRICKVALNPGLRECDRKRDRARFEDALTLLGNDASDDDIAQVVAEDARQGALIISLVNSGDEVDAEYELED